MKSWKGQARPQDKQSWTEEEAGTGEVGNTVSVLQICGLRVETADGGCSLWGTPEGPKRKHHLQKVLLLEAKGQMAGEGSPLCHQVPGKPEERRIQQWSLWGSF